MFNILGAMLVSVGLLFLFGVWFTRRQDIFLLEITLGPVFIYAGFQLLTR